MLFFCFVFLSHDQVKLRTLTRVRSDCCLPPLWAWAWDDYDDSAEDWALCLFSRSYKLTAYSQGSVDVNWGLKPRRQSDSPLNTALTTTLVVIITIIIVSIAIYIIVDLHHH